MCNKRRLRWQRVKKTFVFVYIIFNCLHVKHTDSEPAAVTNSCNARTDSACSMTNTHCDRSGGIFLSAIFSRKQCRLPKPSAANMTRSPVAVHDRHTMSSCIFFVNRIDIKFKIISVSIECVVKWRHLPYARMKHHPARIHLPFQPSCSWINFSAT